MMFLFFESGFVGPVVPEIWVGRQEKNKMVEPILIFGRAFCFTIGGKADRKINKVSPNCKRQPGSICTSDV